MSSSSISFVINNGVLERCTGSHDGNIVIPDGVTVIGEGVFRFNRINSIVIPEGVKEIKKKAFYDCPTLNTINIPRSLKVIGEDAFLKTSVNQLSIACIESWVKLSFENPSAHPVGWKTEILIDGKQLSELVIPNGTKVINKFAFMNFDFFKKISLPEGLEIIEERAFENCSSLQSINFPKSLKKLGERAFSSCYRLNPESMIIPEGITAISNNCFWGCHDLSQISLPSSLREIGDDAFYCCESLYNVVLPKNLKKIGEHAFGHCDKMTEIEIPASIGKISPRTFEACENLQKVVIDHGITSIGRSAFDFCRNLEAITIPQSVTSIEASAFEFCYKLSNVVIPDSVKYINISAFNSCRALKSIFFGENIKSIRKSAFYRCDDLEEIIINSNIQKIEKDAFGECKALHSIKINDIHHWLSIEFTTPSANPLMNGAYLLLDGDPITELRIPEDVTEIGKYAFCGSHLKKVILHKGIKKIDAGAFCGCTELEQVTLEGTVLSIGKDAFKDCTQLKKVTPILYSKTDCSASSFDGCTSLETNPLTMDNDEIHYLWCICDADNADAQTSGKVIRYVKKKAYGKDAYEHIMKQAADWQIKIHNSCGSDYGYDHSHSDISEYFIEISPDKVITDENGFAGLIERSNLDTFMKESKYYNDMQIAFVKDWKGEPIKCGSYGDYFSSDDHERWDVTTHYLCRK